MFAESGKAPSLSKSKIFLKKVSCPITSYLRPRSAQGYKTDPHWIIFPECCHNFLVLKNSLFACRSSQTRPKSGTLIGIYTPIKATHGCKKSSPCYQFNSLKFDSKKLFVTTPWDHLKDCIQLCRDCFLLWKVIECPGSLKHHLFLICYSCQSFFSIPHSS